MLKAVVIGMALLVATTQLQADPLAELMRMSNASLLLEQNGRALASKQADAMLIPASTIKLLTGLAALDRWGAEHRFHTDLFMDEQDQLWIKGWGDPMLVSEELDHIVVELQQRGVKNVSAIITDSTLFADKLMIDGRSATDNPYDAPISALAANFNTITFKKTANGIASGEEQTPMTPLAQRFAERYVKQRSSGRVNIAEQDNGARYFAELLAAKLRLAGVTVADEIRTGVVPTNWQPSYRHVNSRTLGEMVSVMLEFSNNFIANMLFIRLAGDTGPLTMAQAQQQMNAWTRQRFGWQDFTLVEGAGLSRANRLSARQLLEAVNAFAQYQDLLPVSDSLVQAKSGTLTGVNTYAGWVQRDAAWHPFVMMVNQPIDFHFRQRVALALAERKELRGLCIDPGC